MKRIRVLTFVVFATLLAAGCDQIVQVPGELTPVPVAPGETAVVEIVPGADEATVAPTEADAIVIEPVPTEGAPTGDINLAELAASGGVVAAVDTTGLPAIANVVVVPATPYDNSEPSSPVGLPEHVRIDFAVEGQDPTAAAPVLYIIPTGQYAGLWDAAGDLGVSGTLAGLQSLINEPLDPFPDAGIPVLPVERVGSAFNDLAVQGKYIDTEGLNGLRFVGRFVDMGDPVSNQGLNYVFEGFTDDGRYFVSLLYPIATTALPLDEEAIDASELELYNADPAAYMAERVAALNALSADDWSPSLTALDNLLASLQVPGSQPTDVVVTASPLVGPTWQWVRTAGESTEATAADPSRYTVSFAEDGTAFIQADCNTVIGTYTTDELGGMTIALGPTTLVACPEGSQADEFLTQLSTARAFGATSDNLSIEIAEDRTTMQFSVSGVIEEGFVTDIVGNPFLSSGVWQWTSTDDPLGTHSAPDPALYTVAFSPEGIADIHADCNRVISTYTATDDGGLIIQLGPTPLIACGPESQDTEFLQSLAAVVFYHGSGNELGLEMLADGGVLNFSLAEQGVIAPEAGAPEAGVPESATPEAGAPEGVGPVAGALVGPTWQWTVLRQINGETAVPEPARYTVTFNADGSANIAADCNSVLATYQAGADGSLSIVPGPSTLAICAEGSLDQVFLGGLTNAQSYTVADGALSIVLQMENGTMVFVPTN